MAASHHKIKHYSLSDLLTNHRSFLKFYFDKNTSEATFSGQYLTQAHTYRSLETGRFVDVPKLCLILACIAFRTCLPSPAFTSSASKLERRVMRFIITYSLNIGSGPLFTPGTYPCRLRAYLVGSGIDLIPMCFGISVHTRIKLRFQHCFLSDRQKEWFSYVSWFIR